MRSAVALAFVLLAGCSSSGVAAADAGLECVDSTGCAVGQLCTENLCTPVVDQCRTDADCGGDGSASGVVCVPRGPHTGAQCRLASPSDAGAHD